MSGDEVLIALQQLLGLAPLLLVYLAGMIVAVIFLRRCPGPSILTLIGAGISIGIIVIQTFLVQYLAIHRAEMGTDMQSFNGMMAAVGLTGNVVRSLAVGLFLIAIFVGRKKKVESLP